MDEEYLFISDCHLDSRRPEITGSLIEFLQTRAVEARCLYILGDLFEVWMGDDDPAQDLQEVVETLQQLSSRCPIFFIAGNRDFLLGDRFASRVGMTILEEPHILLLGQTRVALLHGDILCTDDHDYQLFRDKVRSPAWQAEFLAKPLLERQQIANQLRSESIAKTSTKSSEIMDVNASAVARSFQQNDVDVIIHGHTHRPAVHEYDSNLKRIVLGDWVGEPTYLSWKPDTGFNLCDSRVQNQAKRA